MIIVGMGLVLGCRHPKGDGAPEPSATPEAGINDFANRQPRHAPLPSERVEIPSGTFLAGSRPGSEGRQPQLEPTPTSIELGGFEIDRLPFPNDPKHPALTGVTRDEARSRCAERGARLCTELEWERACRGPANDPFSTGLRFEPRCAEDPTACASGFDVLSLGIVVREWTASDVPSASRERVRAVVRGASRDAPPAGHGCARRSSVQEADSAPDLGFRCCHGAPNAAKIEPPRLGKTFEPAALPAARIAELLKANPRTQALAQDFTLFREPEAADTVVSRGPGDRQGLTFSVAPVIWNPVAGAKILVIVGRSGKTTSVVAAFYPVSDQEYLLAASFVMFDEPGPVALAYDDSIRPRLYFSTCWRCPGETGRLLFREPESVAIVQP